MITAAEIKAVLDKMIDGLAEDIAYEFNSRDVAPDKLDEVIRYVFRAFGNSIDKQAVISFLKEETPDIEVENVGRNDELGYIWARLANAERSSTGRVKPEFMIRIEDRSNIYFVPGSDVRPEKKVAKETA